MTAYNEKAFQAAHGKYLEDATTLTDGDIEQLAIISDKLAARTRAKREGYAPIETPEERKMWDSRATRRDVWQACEDVIMPALAVQRFKRKQLESQIVEMAKKIEEMQTEINYAVWARQQEADRVPQ